jgi:hypothetical protein
MSKDHYRQTDQDNASKNCYGIKRRDVLLSGGSGDRGIGLHRRGVGHRGQ